MTVGKVWLVGAGPGDPDLITVRGLEVLSAADVVLHDALSHPALLDHCRIDALVRDVGKRPGERYPPQERITAELVEHARAGRNVARLKGGDPFLFARGSEEAAGLVRAGIPFEIVPGISSPVAASAFAGISLTHRDLSSSVTFITGSDKAGEEWSPDAWQRLATATDTICVLMGMRRIREIASALVDGGRAPGTPAAVVQWGARPAQRVVVATLATIADAALGEGLANPAVIVVGDVVALRETLRWYDAQPLFGKRVLIARPEHQARASARAVRARGAEPVLFAAISIEDPPDPGPLLAATDRLAEYDWIVFTSVNGVERFFTALGVRGRDARAVGSRRVGAIGAKTAAALRAHGIVADVVAREFVGEALAEAILALGPPGRVLVPRALVARDELPRALRAAGGVVDVVAAYQTRPVGPEKRAELARRLAEAEIDVVLFSSSSMVDAVCGAAGDRAAELLGRVTVASIGPITTRRLVERGVRVDVTATTYTVDGVLDALEAHFAARGPAPP